MRVGLLVDIVSSRDMDLAEVVGMGAPRNTAGEKKRCTLAWLFARLVDGWKSTSVYVSM